MKIGIIGLGNIAQKAYLPVLLTEYPEVEWHLCTRNETNLTRIGKQYRLEHLHSSLDSLLEVGLDAAFVHTPTFTHGEVIHALLANGVDVYVDKPVSESLEETKGLYALAEKRGKLLVAGFNRRFAPMIEQAKNIKEKNMLIVQKNRVNSTDRQAQFMLYDLFIHPLDTALYLLDGEIESMTSQIIEKDGKLERAWAMLETKETSCFVSMNCLAGANEESVEIHSPEGITKIKNLTHMEIVKNNKEEVHGFDDWKQTLTKRGFQPIIHQFIEAVDHGGENPVSAQSSILSHEICQRMLDNHQNNQ